MTYLLSILRNNHTFLIPFSIGWIIALSLTTFHGKISTHLFINNYHADWSDFFFRYYTELGGWIPFLIALILAFFHYRMAIVILISQFISTIITTTLKYIFMVPRPSVVFSQHDIDIHIVEGITPHMIYSFPSGHTSTAFALFFAISIFCPRNWQKAICLTLASLVGFSRIYLSQHFLEDTLAGSVIGIISVLLITPIIKKYKPFNNNHKDLLNTPHTRT